MERVKLTQEQHALVDQFNGLVKRMKLAGIAFVFDTTDSYLGVLNNKEVDELQSDNFTDDAVCIEDAVDWRSVNDLIDHVYSNHTDSLHASFKENV